MEETVFGVILRNTFVGISFLLFFKVFVSERYYLCGTYMDREKIQILE